jgi:hypothetical protein
MWWSVCESIGAVGSNPAPIPPIYHGLVLHYPGKRRIPRTERLEQVIQHNNSQRSCVIKRIGTPTTSRCTPLLSSEHKRFQSHFQVSFFGPSSYSIFCLSMSQNS